MLFQITTAGRALIEANPTGVPITRADFGSAFNYVPATEPTGLTGSVVYTTNAVFLPAIVNTNTLRYSVFIPGPVGPFTFGEVALYSGSTLMGVGAQVYVINKTVGTVDNQYRLDVFIDTAPGSRFASFEVVSSATRNFYPRVSSVDELVSPHYDANNAYVIYGSAQVGQGFMAYSDPTGAWTFSNKPHVWFQGEVTSRGAQGIQSNDLLGATYNGTLTDLVIQFITGPQRGFCRKVTGLTTGGAVLWNTDMLELPDVGDEFIIQGPSAAVGFSGLHNSLDGIQGGTLNERFHMTQAEHAAVQYPRMKTRIITDPTGAILDSDDDTYIEIAQDCVFSVGQPNLTTYPIGGLSVIRAVGPATLTIQGVSGATIEPDNSVTASINAGDVMTFAVVRRSATVWDLVAPADGSSIGGGGGNVNHVYPATRSAPSYIPRYALSGSPTGPVANIELSRLSVTDTGLRLYPGDLTVAEAWTAPALVVWPLAGGTVGSSPTGLPNSATSFPLPLTINGTLYTLAVLGSAAQTMSALVAALNSSAATIIAGAATATFSVVRGKIILTVTSGAGTTTVVVGTTSTLLDTVDGGSYIKGASATSQTNAIGNNAIVLDQFDAQSKQVRVVDASSIAVGSRSQVKGENSAVFGGDYASVDGDRSTVVGSSGGSVRGNDLHIFGGNRAVIGVQPGVTGPDPRSGVIVGGVDSKVYGQATPAPAVHDFAVVGATNVTIKESYSVAVGSSDSTLNKDHGTVLSSDNVVLSGTNSVAISSSGTTAVGKRSVVIASTGITNMAEDGVVVIGGESLNMQNAKNTVVFGNKNKTIEQRNALVYPTDGGVGTSFTLTLAASGSGAALKLTTDGLAASALNGMKVDSCWAIRGSVACSIGTGTDHRAWTIDAMLYPSGTSAGSISPMGQRIEVLGSTAGAANWELDLSTFSGNTQIMHLALSTLQASGSLYDTVNASAVLTVTRVPTPLTTP